MTLNMGVCVGVDASVGVSVGVEGAETEVIIVGAEVSGIDILGVEEDGAGAGVENMMVDWESVNGAESERSSWSDIRGGGGGEGGGGGRGGGGGGLRGGGLEGLPWGGCWGRKVVFCFFFSRVFGLPSGNRCHHRSPHPAEVVVHHRLLL